MVTRPTGSKSSCRELTGDRARQLHRPCSVARRQDHRELLAADPAHVVLRTGTVPRTTASRASTWSPTPCPWTSLMRLKSSMSSRSNATRARALANLFQLGAEPLVKRTVVQQGRQRIGLRLVLQHRPGAGVVECERGRVREPPHSRTSSSANAFALWVAPHGQHALLLTTRDHADLELADSGDLLRAAAALEQQGRRAVSSAVPTTLTPSTKIRREMVSAIRPSAASSVPSPRISWYVSARSPASRSATGSPSGRAVSRLASRPKRRGRPGVDGRNAASRATAL